MKLKSAYVLSGFICAGILGAAALHTIAATKNPLPITNVKLVRTLLRRQAVGSAPVTVLAAHVANNGTISVTGNSNGVVTVTNVQNNQTIATFQMNASEPVRQVFIVGGGQTVGAAQAGNTLFWSLTSGQQTGQLSQEAYGFTQDGSKFLTYDKNYHLNIYSYPGMVKLYQLPAAYGGPQQWNFSPDGHYFEVMTTNSRPSLDSTYPYPIPRDHGNFSSYNLYDMTTGQAVGNPFTELADTGGTFSADSQFYTVTNSTWIEPNGTNTDGNFQYEMATGTITQVQ